MIKIIRIPALETNYIWLIHNHQHKCVVVDPGESTKILSILKKFQFTLIGILLTHYHHDHIHGVHELMRHFPKTIVYGSIETYNIGVSTVLVSEGDEITLLQNKFKVFNFPGHTLYHIGFYRKPWLFSGDTIFSAGCGKIYSGLAKEMYNSFLKIKQLPRNTLIFSGHEYTLMNINWAINLLPYDKSIINYHKKIITLHKIKKFNTPTTLNLELKVNPFFRCDHISIKKSLNFFPNKGEEWKLFHALRNQKDTFQSL